MTDANAVTDPTPMQKLHIPALIEKVRVLAGADRWTDGLIALALEMPQEFFGANFEQIDGPHFYIDKGTWGGDGRNWRAPAFTASVDAAIALAERVLPGHISQIVQFALNRLPLLGAKPDAFARLIVLAILTALQEGR